MQKIAITLAIPALMLCACHRTDPQHEAAVALDSRIDSAINAKSYAEAITLIDSLNHAYPLELELRKATGLKRAKAYEGLSITEIPRLDSTITACQAKILELTAEFVTRQPSASLPPYMIYKAAAKGDFAAGAGIQARVNTGEDAKDTPWTLAVNAGRNIGQTRIDVECANGARYTMLTPVTDGQMASVSPESAADLAEYLANGAYKATNVTFTGSKGTSRAKITPAESEGIAKAWTLADTNSKLFNALAERERLERQLQIARDQAANAPRPKPEQPE